MEENFKVFFGFPDIRSFRLSKEEIKENNVADLPLSFYYIRGKRLTPLRDRPSSIPNKKQVLYSDN